MNTQLEMLTAILNNIFPVDVWDDSAERTADRILRYWESMKPHEQLDFELTAFSPGEYGRSSMVVVSPIEFSSMCAHHLLPFYGTAHVGYIPHSSIVGLSKIPRLVAHYAGRPQIQERMTHEIAHHLKKVTDAKGVMVVIEATHTCMSCRGVRAHNSAMVTSCPVGIFRDHSGARDEFFAAIRRSK